MKSRAGGAGAIIFNYILTSPHITEEPLFVLPVIATVLVLVKHGRNNYYFREMDPPGGLNGRFVDTTLPQEINW